MLSKDEMQSRLVKIKDQLRGSTLIAVSKYTTDELVELAYNLNQRIFGESRVQDLLKRSERLSSLSEIEWHFIGKLQSNKINNLLKVKNLVAIHSVDSLKLLKELLSKEEKAVSSNIDLFIQVNTSKEMEKSGISEILELKKLVQEIENSNSKVFNLKGLMTIGPIRTDTFEEDTKNSFKELVKIKEELSSSFENLELKLSMGMSSDYHWAVELNTSYVRIGRAIFKEGT